MGIPLIAEYICVAHSHESRFESSKNIHNVFALRSTEIPGVEGAVADAVDILIKSEVADAKSRLFLWLWLSFFWLFGVV
jgi:hypothetical protein